MRRKLAAYTGKELQRSNVGEFTVSVRNTMRKHLSHIPVDAIASQGHPLEIVPLEVVLVPGLLCDVSIWAAQIAALKPYADVARRPLPTTGQPVAELARRQGRCLSGCYDQCL